jgi:hypothetical protein
VNLNSRSESFLSAGEGTLETTDPQQAKRFEQELASRGVSYMTQITKTKRDGLRYVIKLLGNHQ